MKLAEPINHIMIPDTQCRPGLRLDYMRWAGQYVADHFLAKHKPIKVIHIGDHWDMPSLSSYDRGTGKMEGRRVNQDIEAGNQGFALLDDPIQEAVAAEPDLAEILEKHFFFGNHEDRITRATNNNPQLDGLLSLDLLDTRDWQRHDFLVPVAIDGVVYAHYFYNPMTGKPFSGENLMLRLKNLGHSFSMGHQQTYLTAERYVNGVQQRGLVAGSYYVHDEDYKGPQGNAHWRGLVVCHAVQNGHYEIMQVSLEYLCRRYEGVTLSRYKYRHYK